MGAPGPPQEALLRPFFVGRGCPFAVPMAKGRWRLYYEGYDAAVGTDWKARGSQAARGIGLALSEEAAEGTEVAGRPFRRRTVK